MYKPQHYVRAFVSDKDTYFECLKCGAITRSRGQHNKWHHKMKTKKKHAKRCCHGT